MAKEKVISEITQTTRRGLTVHRVNYEKHSEFSVTFNFHTGDSLKIIMEPKELYSIVSFIWFNKSKKKTQIDQVIQHRDPMTILNEVGIIEHHIDGDKSNPLNGLMIIYKSLENESNHHFDNLIVVNEVPIGDSTILVYDRFVGIPSNVLTDTNINNIIKSKCEDEKMEIIKKALNKIYGTGIVKSATNA